MTHRVVRLPGCTFAHRGGDGRGLDGRSAPAATSAALTKKAIFSPPTACAPTWWTSTRPGCDADVRRADGGRRPRRRTACFRASRRIPASAGTRSPPARGRASTARRTTPSTGSARATSTTARRSPPTGCSRPTHPAGGRARRQEGRLDGVGRVAEPRRRARRARWSTSAPSSPTAASCSTTTCRGSRPAPTPSASRTSASTSTPPRGWTNVPASFSPAKQEQLKVTNTAFPAADNVDRFYDLYIYDSTNDSTTNYDHVLVVPVHGRQGRHAGVANLAAGRLGRTSRSRSPARAPGRRPAST